MGLALATFGACAGASGLDVSLGKVVVNGTEDSGVPDAAVPPDGGNDGGDAGLACNQPRVPRVEFRRLDLSPAWGFTRGRGHRVGIGNGASAYKDVWVDGGDIDIRDFDRMLDDLNVFSDDGTVCGANFAPSGYAQLSLQFSDGGTFNSHLDGPCYGYRNGWWLTYVPRRLERGHGTIVDWVSDRPLVVGEIGADGTVLASEEPPGEIPRHMLLPNEERLPSLSPNQPIYPRRIVRRDSVAGSAVNWGGYKVPVRWRDGGVYELPHPQGADGTFIFELGEDDRMCGQLRVGTRWPAVIWTERDEYLDISAATADSGVDIFTCLAVLADDWYAVGYYLEPGSPSSESGLGFVRVQWDCPD